MALSPLIISHYEHPVWSLDILVLLGSNPVQTRSICLLYLVDRFVRCLQISQAFDVPCPYFIPCSCWRWKVISVFKVYFNVPGESRPCLCSSSQRNHCSNPVPRAALPNVLLYFRKCFSEQAQEVQDVSFLGWQPCEVIGWEWGAGTDHLQWD